MSDLENAISATLGLEKDELILQSYEKLFDDYANIEVERIAGPTKIMVKVKAPVINFPVTINVNKDNMIQDVSDSHFTSEESLRPVSPRTESDSPSINSTVVHLSDEDTEDSSNEEQKGLETFRMLPPPLLQWSLLLEDLHLSAGSQVLPSLCNLQQ
ncbi:hypothetical protein HOLleu_01479 [Holothuria leucospilota]|uniref:Uncharacterized protein n=1 Tax=Holothuria leucospilota TaxID=206669 RepID=A0A9Q1HKZ0_HOLLE|nr:hypothetical protein HOLleu_01479 [Holothuria leucospilota]